MSVLCEYHLHVQLGPATGCVSLTRRSETVLWDGLGYTRRCCATDRHVATVTLCEDGEEEEEEEVDGAGWMLGRRKWRGWGGWGVKESAMEKRDRGRAIIQ